MGKYNKTKRIRCSCGRLGYSKTSELCMKCYRREKLGHKSSSSTLDNSPSPLSRSKRSRKKTTLGGKMDSKHFSSRSTTDNLPSSLSTPGERAGLTSPSSVDTSVASSSTNTNTMSPHLPSTCAASGPPPPPPDGAAQHTSTSNNTVNSSDAVTDSSPLPTPDAKDSQSSILTDTSDKPYDPKKEPSFCSSSSSINSHSSLSELSAAISSSSAHNDELNGNRHFSTDGDSTTTTTTTTTTTHLSPAAKNPTSSSLSSPSNGQINITTDTKSSSSSVSNTKNGQKSVVPDNSNKDNGSAPTDKINKCERENKDSLQNTKSTAPSVSILKDVKKPSNDDQSQQSSSPRGTKRSHAESENESSNPPQKNKKRCFICSSKLELAQRTIGKCRCERVFCPSHRLPELHDCEFNHKEDGRREAREKMVKPTRHMGTSFRRDDRK